MPPPGPPPVPSSLPPSTPNPSRFRLPRRPDRTGLSTPGQGGSGSGGGGGSSSKGAAPSTAARRHAAAAASSSQARPTPRFVPSWKQAPPTTPRAGGDGSAARPFSQFSQFSQFSAPRQSRHSRDEQDAIDEGSSPPVIPESPPVLTPAPSQAVLSAAPKTLWRPKRSARPKEDIEEAEDSSGSDAYDETVDVMEHSRTDEESENHGGRMIPGNHDDANLGDRGYGAHANDDGTHGLPSTQLPKPPLSARPFKRRKLFVSPGLITSSPPEGLLGEPSVAPRRRGKPRRRLEDDDDVDDVDSLDSSGYEDDGDIDYHRQRLDDDDMRDIMEYGEMLEYGDGTQLPEEYYHGPDFDDDEEDYMVLDLSPSHRRRQQQKSVIDTPTAPTPPATKNPQQGLFTRARLFVPASNLRSWDKDAEDDAEGDGPFPMHDEDDGAKHPDVQAAAAAAAPLLSSSSPSSPWQQPPADFFSPQKRQKRKGPNKKAGGGGGDQQYVPGGLAAELRDWLVQIKSGAWAAGGSGGSDRTTAANTSAVLVSEVASSSAGLRLALGRPNTRDSDTEPRDAAPMRLVLGGEGRRQTDPSSLAVPAGSTAELTENSIVHIAPPAWEIVLDGQLWTVASDWRVE